jgi:hypothetical protein
MNTPDEPLRKSKDDILYEVPVDWEALEDAFENNAPEVHSYLHLYTGEVLRVVDGVADPEMHSRIAANSAYLRVEPVSSREQYRWMERFIQAVETEELKAKLAAAIDGKGAFRRFKDVLMSYNAEREGWFAFRSERLRVFMEAWLAAHQVVAVPRPELVAPPDAELPEVETDTPAIAGLARDEDLMRSKIQEVLESLTARDLEKVLAFAEFVRARRVARGLVYHQRSKTDAVDSSEAPASSKDEPLPSSRKMSAAR